MHVLHLPFDHRNPYQALLLNGLREHGTSTTHEQARWQALRGLEKRQINLIHFHWVHYWAIHTPRLKFAVRWPCFALQLLQLRRRGIRIVWTVHNLHDHEAHARVRDRMMSFLISRLADAIIVHSNWAAGEVARTLGVNREKIEVIPHGTYVGAYPNIVSRPDARKKLDILGDKCVFLFCGAIRPYKGVLDLVSAFRRAAAENTQLIIAGRVHGDELRSALCRAVRESPAITLHDEFIPDDMIQTYMNAADAVVFPYGEFLTSGAVVLAMSFRKACIVPQIPVMTEVVGPEAGLFFEHGSVADLARCLSEAARSKQLLVKMGGAALTRTQAWSWNRVAERTAEIYRSVCQRRLVVAANGTGWQESPARKDRDRQ